MKRLFLAAAVVALFVMAQAAPALAANNTGAGNRACDASHGAAAARADAHTDAINCAPDQLPPPE